MGEEGLFFVPHSAQELNRPLRCCSRGQHTSTYTRHTDKAVEPPGSWEEEDSWNLAPAFPVPSPCPSPWLPSLSLAPVLLPDFLRQPYSSLKPLQSPVARCQALSTQIPHPRSQKTDSAQFNCSRKETVATVICQEQ